MFKKAEKKQSKLRLLLGSPSGGGKTYSSLSIASGLGGNICLIDTENGSASLYADLFNFDVAELDKCTVDSFLEFLKAAEKHDYNVLIMDSTTHIWEEILEENQKILSANKALNSYTVWMQGNSKYRRFIDAILKSPLHIICTARMKTEYVLQENSKGRMTPTKVGMGMEQRAGFEYEFTLVMEGNLDHVFTITKDRTSLFPNEKGIIALPGKEFGLTLINWLNSGIELKPITQPETTQTIKPLTRDEKIKKLPDIAKENGILDLADFAVFAKMDKNNPDKLTSINLYISEPEIYLETIKNYHRHIKASLNKNEDDKLFPETDEDKPGLLF